MMELIRFGLFRKFKDKTTLIVNVVILLAIIIVLNIDLFVTTETSTSQVIVHLDNSMLIFSDELQNIDIDGISFVIYGNHYDANVSYENNKIKVSHNLQDETTLELIKNSMEKVMRNNYLKSHEFMSEYVEQINNLEVQTIQKQQGNNNWILISVVYFIVVNYCYIISSDVLFEKQSHILETLLTTVSAKKHLLSKIVLGYLQPLIQTGLIVVYVVIVSIFRSMYDGFEGLLKLIPSNNTITSISSITFSDIVYVLLILLTGLLIIQVTMVFVVSKCKNVEQATSIQSLIYIIMFVIYCFGLFSDTSELFTGNIARVLSYTPVTSMLFMSDRILNKNAVQIEIMMAIITNLSALYILIVLGIKNYKTDILNYHN